MRLQKYLAASGLCSRRAAEDLIKSGLIKVNNKTVTELGVKVDPEKDIVSYKDRPLEFEQKKLFIFNKPKGVWSTLRDPHTKKDLEKYIAKTKVRAFPVGRLDRDAFGLMLLTNDGEFADRFLHPRYQVERVYYLLVKGDLAQDSIRKASLGIKLEDGLVKAKLKKLTFSDEISLIFDKPKQGYSLVEARVIEGRKHLVKRLMAHINCPVEELCRYSHGPFKLENLRPGELREIRNYDKLL